MKLKPIIPVFNLLYQVLYVTPLFAGPALAADPLPGVTNATCPGLFEAPRPDPSGWNMTNFLYVVFDELKTNGETVTTAQVEFDLVGGYAREPIHCELRTPELLEDYSGPVVKGRGTYCTGTTRGYVTTFVYTPNRTHVLVSERGLCGQDPRQRSTLKYEGDLSIGYSENYGRKPTPPAGGTNVRLWRRPVYDPYNIHAFLHLIPPPPDTRCTSATGWEVTNFQMRDGWMGSGAIPWSIQWFGTFISFNLKNLANGYSLQCLGSYTDMPALEAILGGESVEAWHNDCGVFLEDEAPDVPPTWFRLDRQAHVLEVNQTWSCDRRDQDDLIVYGATGSVTIPWDCAAKSTEVPCLANGLIPIPPGCNPANSVCEATYPKATIVATVLPAPTAAPGRI